MSSTQKISVLSRNNVKVLGSGTQPMLFAHGYACDQNMWRYVSPACEKDYKIILFDHVGAGDSDNNFYSKEDIDDLMEALDSNYLGWSANMAPVIMENKDFFYTSEEVSTFIKNIPIAEKELKYFDSGHILPNEFKTDAISWITKHNNGYN